MCFKNTIHPPNIECIRKNPMNTKQRESLRIIERDTNPESNAVNELGKFWYLKFEKRKIAPIQYLEVSP